MILFLAGTSDGRQLIKQLAIVFEKDKHFASQYEGMIVSTLTPYGQSLVESDLTCPFVSVLSGGLDQKEMVGLIEKQNVTLIIDATHPYAINVSSNAIEAAQKTQINYLRYERPLSHLETIETDEKVVLFEDYLEIVDYLIKNDGNVLLTTGSNHLKVFEPIIKQNRVYARILPTVTALNKAEEAGLTPNRIVAVQGPFSSRMNEAMLSEWDIRYLVTKDSAEAGGFQEKIESSVKMGVTCLILRRPSIAYGRVFDNQRELIDYLTRV